MAYRLAHYFCLMSQAPCHLSNQKRDRYRMFLWTYYKSFSFSYLLLFFLIKKLSVCPPYFCPYPRWFHSRELIVQEITASWIKAALMQCQAVCLLWNSHCFRRSDVKWRPVGDQDVFSFFLWWGFTCFPVSAPRMQHLFTWDSAATDFFFDSHLA